VILADPTSYRGLVLCQLWHTASRQIVTFANPVGKAAAPCPTVSLTISHGIRARALLRAAPTVFALMGSRAQTRLV
jgi:hypothetical protein